jgi:hypothetical protein
VLDGSGTVIHTYPVTLGPDEDHADDSRYKAKAETKQALEEDIRKRAYLMWEQDGCPEGRADDYWQQALHQHLRERAYVLWQQEGSPEGRADENWNRLREFGAQ